jgi:phosphate transport system substrate-binding protein
MEVIMTQRNIIPAILLGLTSLAATSVVSARETIEVVGSSTVYPFSTVVAERYGRASGKPTPKIESTGSGGGMKLFCSGVGSNYPDITNSSRRMKASEFSLCQKCRLVLTVLLSLTLLRLILCR